MATKAPSKKKTATVDATDVEIVASSTMAMIALADIEVDARWNPRKDAGDISDLTESIRTNGIQTPVRVQAPKKEGGKYFLVYGFRRVAAAMAAGLVEVPACVEPSDSSVARLLALNVQENVNRRQLNPMEEAEGASRLMSEGLSEEVLMKLLGWSRTMLTQRLKLLDYSSLLKDALRAGRITIQHARSIARCDEEDHEKFVIKAEELTTTALDDLVNRHLTPPESRDEKEEDEGPKPLAPNNDDDEEDTDAPDPEALSKQIRTSLQTIADMVHWSDADKPTLAQQLGRIGNIPFRSLPLVGLQSLASFLLTLESALVAERPEEASSASAEEPVEKPRPSTGRPVSTLVDEDEEDDEEDDF